jgi:hypothetical protein
MLHETTNPLTASDFLRVPFGLRRFGANRPGVSTDVWPFGGLISRMKSELRYTRTRIEAERILALVDELKRQAADEPRLRHDGGCNGEPEPAPRRSTDHVRAERCGQPNVLECRAE